MKSLIYIPVIHTQVDMGSMANPLKEAYLERYGQDKWASHIESFLFRRLKSFFVAHQLLVARDRFIAQRIDETLKEGENGLLFIGIKHRVDRYLARGISVKYLFHRLPFQYAKRFERSAILTPLD